MRSLLLYLIIFLATSAMAQHREHEGQLLDIQRKPISGVHIRNTTAGELGVSDIDGFFRILASPGDTLLFSSVGYKTLMILCDQNWPSEGLKLFMQEGTLELDELTIRSIPPIERFKEQIMENQPEDSIGFWYFGVQQPVIKGDPLVTGKVHKKLLYAISQPTSFLYYNLSKAEKEKRKFYQLEKNSLRDEKIELKFTREWVAEHTGYEGDKLTSFIAYCGYTPQYIARTPEYMILENMKSKMAPFEAQYSE